ncbi:efflux RND transporter permease subunit, partial [Thioclava sp. BHET1]
DYMTATSQSNGQTDIQLTFKSGTDPDVAQIQVQNKLQLVSSQLPQVVQSRGITVNKANSGFLMVIGFTSTDGRMNQSDIADYIDSQLNDTIKRVDGVGSTQIFGSRYAMRIWLKPDKLAEYSLMPSDIEAAIQAQNAQVSAGQLGAIPSAKGQQLNATVTAGSRLQTVEQFRNIVLKSDTDGSLVRLDDVARVELGAETYGTAASFNGKPAAGLAINLATGANAIATAARVRSALDQFSGTLPEGLSVNFPYDTTPFVKLSIEEVVKTLLEAIVLVFFVMLVFLQNIRATLIPTLAVPVVLLGTFAVLSAVGFSINTLTMFAMVLAIGLLVDDAIVVVENVERVMHEEDLSPREATRKSMKEISGALVGIATVLSAVFVPMAFFGGSVGVIYKQFSVPIVSAMILSVAVALILTPALCATILKKPQHGAKERGLSGMFNRNFDRMADGYRRGAAGLLRRAWIGIIGFVVVVVLTGVLILRVPNSFLPTEDQGILLTAVTLPVGATEDRTLDVLGQVRNHFLEAEKNAVQGVFTVAGFGFGGSGQNVGLAFIPLKPFAERTSPAVSAQAIVGRAMGAFSQIRSAFVFALAPPAIQGLGNSNGFDFYLQDVKGAGHNALIAARNQLLGMAAQDKLLTQTRPAGQEDQPQFAIHIDQDKAAALGVSIADINSTLSTAWGSSYVNDFIDRGRVKPVYVQGDIDSRMQPNDLDKWYVRNATGGMVPFSAFASGRWTYGSPRLERYN